jgi:hypothetical protein
MTANKTLFNASVSSSRFEAPLTIINPDSFQVEIDHRRVLVDEISNYKFDQLDSWRMIMILTVRNIHPRILIQAE